MNDTLADTSPRTDASPTPLLEIADLHTHFDTADGEVRAVDGVSLSVRPGRTLCVVGESGCGKSITARSVLQLVDSPGRIVSGAVHWAKPGEDPVELTGLETDGEQMRAIRGNDIGMVFQEPMASLSPMYTVGAQLSEAIRLHREVDPAEARRIGVELLERVGIPQAEGRFDAYPFQLSGGMCQRVMIAIALSCDPALLIADEPTTALDVTTQARILDLLKGLQRDTGMAMMFITHDLGVVAEIADDVTVMYLGRAVEHGTVEQIFTEPKHPYTRALLESLPTMDETAARRPLTAIRGMVPHPQNRPSGCPFRTRCDFAMPGVCDVDAPPETAFADGHQAYCHLYSSSDERAVPLPAPTVREPIAAVERTGPTDDAPLLEVKDLTKHYAVSGGMFRRRKGTVHAVDGVDLTIRPGETLGLVGESGCGKTTLGRSIARLVDASSGEILFRKEDGTQVDLAQLQGAALRRYRTQVRVIFQDPFSSLNPRMTVEQIVGEPLKANGLASGSTLSDRVAQMLRRVGIRPEYMPRYPHAFSGGERQRLNIARALITRPRLVVADEPVSALDVSVRAQILNLLSDLQEEFGLTYLFISHDLSVVEHVSDRVAVMYLGRIIEEGPTDALYRSPQHPYTQALLHAVPIPDPSARPERAEAGSDELPDPMNPPAGCSFHTRCAYMTETPCATVHPELRPAGESRSAACHLSDQLTLPGIARTRNEDRSAS
ncbi:ABC transporter ATP-binding protein [Ruania alba]|uniref:Peptide/nickel transport system ATP-binding protein n=1 Tax=Ruania alba TaxID=648782 RepID=A0A1H5BIT7_9MICO|nr:ABC transporter ATP-binding protein [Ruania alba]SED54543.1 peptide/nickel transport system ATP-binding protein [Ruania alba]